MRSKTFLILLLLIGCLLCFFSNCYAQEFAIPKFDFISRAESPDDVTLTIQLFFLFTVLSFAPALFLLTTSFARVIIVLSFLKKAAGLQDIPAQLIAGLALFVTAMVMMPVWNEVNTNALQPYINKEVTQQEALTHASKPIRTFMLKQTREKDIALFVHFSKIEKPASPDDVPFYILVPSFIISEMKTAFIYGFLIYIPFLIIDLVVASVLLAMGMMVLPPIVISAPFKIILFILVDGWYLVLRSLVGSFN
ncbi:MAG: flagellar type III secretion system pore protein FliP [Candidatus Omnitrophica bacterium]|nr:flagellar type III secretion system pore protein FliP [Candidatus Omnitrophota bacterium]